MSAMPGPSQPMTVSNNSKEVILPTNSEPRPSIEDAPFEPCSSSHSFFLFAQGSIVLCLHHNTLTIERRFEGHSRDVQLIAVNNNSEIGTGRLVLSYDAGQTAIIWDLATGEQISRFISYESLKAAQWMRNGRVVFGKVEFFILTTIH